MRKNKELDRFHGSVLRENALGAIFATIWLLRGCPGMTGGIGRLYLASLGLKSDPCNNAGQAWP
jgi:hypothetical protein